MNVNLTRYFLAFTCITLFTLTPLISSAADAESFIDKLKMHYQNAPKLKVFSLNYHYLGASPYQGWDYQLPERYMALRMVEIDLVKKHFVENDIHHFPDGMTFNRVQFQNDKETYCNYQLRACYLLHYLRQETIRIVFFCKAARNRFGAVLRVPGAPLYRT